MSIPKDPMLLLSFVNTRLRDRYDTLDALCEDLALERESLCTTLGAIGYEYKESLRQFR